MTTAQVVETSVTNNSLSKDYPHLDDHTRQTTDIPGFKPFTNFLSLQLLRECKEVIMGAALVKDYQVSMVEGILNPDDSDRETLESDIEEYEQDLQRILKVCILCLMYIKY